MRVIYVGPGPAARIVESRQTAERGEPIEVDDALGARLVEQSTWQSAGPGEPAQGDEQPDEGEAGVTGDDTTQED